MITGYWSAVLTVFCNRLELEDVAKGFDICGKAFRHECLGFLIVVLAIFRAVTSLSSMRQRDSRYTNSLAAGVEICLQRFLAPYKVDDLASPQVN